MLAAVVGLLGDWKANESVGGNLVDGGPGCADDVVVVVLVVVATF